MKLKMMEMLEQLENGEKMLRQLSSTFSMVADSLKELREFVKENVDAEEA